VTTIPLNEVRKLIAEVLRPGHFFIGKAAALEWQQQTNEQVPWEVYRGRLLDPAHTRLRQAFESWNVFWIDEQGRSTEPILSLKLASSVGQIHVTRAIYCYAWEAYDAGDRVVMTREVRKWVCELIGTLSLEEFENLADVRDELAGLLFRAVVGNSRLPLTSVEAALPAFSLGRLAYFHRPRLPGQPPVCQPMQSFQQLIQEGLHAGLTWLEKIKLLEAVLRQVAPAEIGPAAELFCTRWSVLGHGGGELLALLRTLFNEVALSPYTGFVDNALAFVRACMAAGYLAAKSAVDFLGYLLRQTVRHLTAYDLITFHHRGANYPDALLLDAVLKNYLNLIESNPDFFMVFESDDIREAKAKRIRRRALRQSWLLRRFYEGLPVPDAPTSPGENLRILPPPYARVPEEQILVPARRTKRLYAYSPQLPLGVHGREALRQSIADLQYAEELQELGTALFLDRPLGVFKPPGEPDQTLLLSYEAFSRQIAERRLVFLADQLDAVGLATDLAGYQRTLCDALPVAGLPLRATGRIPSPGAVSLDDALRVADDFLLVCTTRQTAREFLAQFDFTALAERFGLSYLDGRERLLIVRGPSIGRGGQGTLVVYDADFRCQLELEPDPSGGYQSRAGREYPAAGLRLLRLWESFGSDKELQERDLTSEAITIEPVN
jgi:hypothetical protein